MYDRHDLCDAFEQAPPDEGRAGPAEFALDAPTPTSSRAAPRSAAGRAAVRLPWVFAGYALGFLCGAAAVALLWLGVAASSRPSARNTPRALLAHRTRSAPLIAVAPPRNVLLTTADLTFGEQQVERMVRDRPEMARFVGPRDAVWQFCARAFAGDAVGRRVFWDGGTPDGDTYLADHQAPYSGDSGYIRIRREYASGYDAGNPLPCEQLWSCAVYELENMRGDPAFNALYDRAMQGELSREDWIRENTQLEYEAYRRTAHVYEADWLPMARQRAVALNGSDWGVGVPATYEAWISAYQDPNGYPWDCWGRYYDDEIAPYLSGRGG